MLKKLLMKDNVNLYEIDEIIIRKKYVGSVVKKSEVDEEDSEDDDDDDERSDVFGVMYVLNIKEKKKMECVKKLRRMMMEI
jgi:hypothetical protein